MFERPLHQCIAQVLSSLNGPLLKKHGCLFGGGTVIALRFGEYRESVDIYFLVSDLHDYRSLRQLLTSADGVNAIMLPEQPYCLQASKPTEGGLYAGGTKNSNSRHATASHKNTEILRA